MGPNAEAAARAHVVEQVFDGALPGWRKEWPAKDKEYGWLRDQASRAKGALRRQSELAEKLGGNTLDMDVDNLHPWAWES